MELGSGEGSGRGNSPTSLEDGTPNTTQTEA
eukprot:CAMPEP_0172933014 /NCGR_PEP_ID=MMETSP1075-20121228/220292_1 /TAXON_ID=2916 /ORGANISM="Ceratium fusus, Strain PA161109" /LENGTH=30 /DNA_ID= /DNA_START= /DNA_END= /DNA_ORIENTATION=